MEEEGRHNGPRVSLRVRVIGQDGDLTDAALLAMTRALREVRLPLARARDDAAQMDHVRAS
mgnify:CR=1 FL=1